MNLDTLNQNQHQAVTASEQFTRVIAGAGSGKTLVLTMRIAYLINELNINPRRIFAITFTNKAAGEMKERVAKLTDNQPTVVSTFHSLAARFLREEITRINYPSHFVIIDEEDQTKLIKAIIKDLQSTLEVAECLSFIGEKKTAGVTVQELEQVTTHYSFQQRAIEIYKEYENRLNQNGYLDFDDLLLKTVYILKNYPEVREKWQRRISHLLVDEFQDTNDIQYQMIKLLLAPDASLYVVGDADQTIYSWRGANSRLILEFEHDFPGAATYILNLNYRSTQEILDSANRLIDCNTKRIKKDLIANNGSGEKVEFRSCFNSTQEAELIAEEITKLERNNNLSDIAVLFRSIYLSRPLEMAFNRAGIKYRIYGAVRFFERAEIKDIICYLRFLLNPQDQLAFERIINVPRRSIGKLTIDKFREIAEITKMSLSEAFKVFAEKECSKGALIKINEFFQLFEDIKNKQFTFSEMTEYILTTTGYRKELQEKEETDRIANLDEFKNYLDEFQKNNPDAELAELIQNITLYTTQDEIQHGDFVNLMTIHAAKGLEYDNVYVIGLSENVFPNKRSLEEGGVEEERRLAYVAFTRAKKKLFLTNNRDFNYATGIYNVTSRFLKEAGLVTEVKQERKPSFSFLESRNTNNNPNIMPVKDDPIDNLWIIGDKVQHSFYGLGTVLETIGSRLVRIEFANQEHGIKTILANHPSLTKAEVK